jgi:hypothetical protein
MARSAAIDDDADWVINTDADEFWMPHGGSLKETFAGIPPEYGIVFALSRHFIPRPADDAFFAERMIVRASPAVALNDPTSPYRPHLKVAHRGDPDITISHGAHSASSNRWRAIHHWHPFEVLHFPFRSSAQWEHKGVRRARGDSQLGQYVAALLASEAGRAHERYEALTVDDAEIERGLEEESLVVDLRLLEGLGLGFEPPTAPSVTFDEDAITASAAVRDADVVRLHRHVDALAARVAAVEERSSHSLAARASTFAVAVLVAVMLVAVALPEALGDRPYDPKPSRVLSHGFLPVLGKFLSDRT